jgi:hypothetical protein
MVVTKSNVTNPNSYVKPPPSNNPFGDPYSNSKNNFSYGGYPQSSTNSKNYNANPLEKPSTPSRPFGNKPASNQVKN